MYLKPLLKTAGIFVASSILVLALPQTALSQAKASQIISDDAIDALDEIVVYGEPTLRLLRDEVFEAEEQFYELFNELNKGKQFDVHCFYRKPVGSHIRHRVCEANFVKNTGSYMPSSIGGNSPPRWAFVRHKSKQMLREMQALVNVHPELHAALVEFGDAKQTLDSVIRDRCANRMSICKK